MKFGVYAPNLGPYGNARALAVLAREAEDAGWDGFFIWDHIARTWPVGMVDPWVALAAIAVATSRVCIGVLVTPIPRRRPWKLAREIVSLDHLSGGRLVFGVGLGSGYGTEWEGLGEETDPKVRGRMLDEGLAVLDGLWKGEPFSYTGQHYHVKDAHFLPRPVQSPRVPIWVAGYWPNRAPMRRAACWDGMFPLYDRYGVGRLDEFIESVAFVLEQRAQLDASGPFDVVYRGMSQPGTEGVERAAQFAEAGATWWIEHLVPMVFGVDDWQVDWPVEAMRERVLQGPPRL
ncbi:MAG: LLM class flavin-dependent oxidoreductase [Anaerolineae bacterium]|nr:LLM class flavin-dependent oxidoreductase [Anaerolineae bacterium]